MRDSEDSAPVPATVANPITGGDALSSGHAKHTRFYFPDGSFQFIVENTAYSIHRWWVARHSPKWPQVLGNIEHGVTVLENVSVSEMDALLSLIYPTEINIQRHDLTSIEDWTSVLRLSTRWGFASCRKVALDFLKSCVPALPVDRLVLAHELDIPDWLEPAYAALRSRDEPLTLAEARRLRLEDVVAISTSREAIHKEHIQKAAGSLSRYAESLVEVEPTPASSTITRIDEASAGTPYLPPDNLPSPVLQSTHEAAQEAIQLRMFSSAPPTEDHVYTTDTPSGNDIAVASPAHPTLVLETPSNDSEQPPLPEAKPSTILPPPRRAKAKAISQELHAKAYELAVDGIIPLSACIGHLAPTIAEWANKHVMHRGPGSMRAFVSALFSRAIRDATFDDAAIAVLKDLRRDINSDIRDIKESKGRSTLRGAGLIDGLVQSISTYALLTPATQEACDRTRGVIFKASETVLPSEEFDIRKHNAIVFVGRLLKDGLLKPHQICEGNLMIACTPEILRDKLIVFGPFLDRSGGGKSLDRLLALHDMHLGAVGNKEDQEILQEIRDLRSQNWVASHALDKSGKCSCNICKRS